MKRRLRTKNKRTTLNTHRQAIAAAKEAAAATRERSAEARTFVNDLTRDVVEVGSTIYIYWHI
jgi:hypothetical protein